MNNLWVFDLDDTLIDNVHDYAEPILDACRLIVKVLGSKAPHVSKIIAIEQEIDKKRLQEINPSTGKLYLYSMERFPGTMVEVYKYLCKSAAVSPKLNVEEELYSIGLRAFDEGRYIANIRPNLLPLVNFLTKKGDKLWILTKGDQRVQEKKINALKETRYFLYFDGYEIVDDKTPAVLAKIKNDFPGMANYWSVGNDYDKDIVPSLAAGFKGIWIPVETWELIGKLGEIESRMDKDRCRKFDNLIEIKEKYEEFA